MRVKGKVKMKVKQLGSLVRQRDKDVSTSISYSTYSTLITKTVRFPLSQHLRLLRRWKGPGALPDPVHAGRGPE